MKQLFTFAITLLVVLAAPPVQSADYQRGVEASLRRDFAAAYQEWEPLARQGDASSQFQLGWLYIEGNGVAQDVKQGIEWYTRSAQQGYAFAQTALGRIYENGTGVQKNDPVALMWYSIAASTWDKSAAPDRDRLAAQMPPDQLSEAQRLLSTWNAR
ncbi:MAG TPA: tetratricopeptide repeat protein [Magnetovibrio sp.]